MTTDGSGNVTGTNVLSPYGETLSSNTSDSFSYAGLTQDTEYGGDAATFRNYSTEQVRWTRPDPYDGSYDLSNPQTMNRYVYAMNNPLNNIDPTGLYYYDESGNFLGSYPGEYYIEDDGTMLIWNSSANKWESPEEYLGSGDTERLTNTLGFTGSGSLGIISGGYGGGAGVGTTSSGPTYTKAQVCAASALMQGGGQTALDAAGMIPGDNAAVTAFQVGTGILSAGIAAYNNSPPADGFLASVGAGLAAAESYSKNISFRGVEIVPVLGNAAAAVSTKRDLNAMGKDFDSCMGGG